MSTKKLPEWDRLLSSAARLQSLLPRATLVGGTAAALHAKHRMSVDADHVIPDLKERFDKVLALLESVAGWKTARVRKPVLILGSLDGIETGIRQLIRQRPLETEMVSTHAGEIKVPTKAEMLRIKGVLILKRNATRDYLDFAAMARQLGREGTGRALAGMDTLYPQANGESALQQLVAQTADPRPYDLGELSLAEYKNLRPEWKNWDQVKKFLSETASGIFNHACEKHLPRAGVVSADRTPVGKNCGGF